MEKKMEDVRPMTDEELAMVSGMCQWKRSLKRPDLQEKDRVRGAIEAALRQMFACKMLAEKPVTDEDIPTHDDVREILAL
jgi:hypothetical protein